MNEWWSEWSAKGGRWPPLRKSKRFDNRSSEFWLWLITNWAVKQRLQPRAHSSYRPSLSMWLGRLEWSFCSVVDSKVRDVPLLTFVSCTYWYLMTDREACLDQVTPSVIINIGYDAHRPVRDFLLDVRKEASLRIQNYFVNSVRITYCGMKSVFLVWMSNGNMIPVIDNFLQVHYT